MYPWGWYKELIKIRKDERLPKELREYANKKMVDSVFVAAVRAMDREGKSGLIRMEEEEVPEDVKRIIKIARRELEKRELKRESTTVEEKKLSARIGRRRRKKKVRKRMNNAPRQLL